MAWTIEGTRFHCTTTNTDFGPDFETADDAMAFQAHLGEDPRKFTDADLATEYDLFCKQRGARGFKAEVYVDGGWNSNAVVWPDYNSALRAARDLYGRWTLTSGFRAVPTLAEPNRPSWDAHVAERVSR